MLRLRTWVCLVLALLFVGRRRRRGGHSQVEGRNVTVKVGEKEQVVELSKDLKITKDGTELERKDRRGALKKDVKVELVEKDGKVVEIKIK